MEWIVNSGGDADRWYIGPSEPTNTQIPLTNNQPTIGDNQTIVNRKHMSGVLVGDKKVEY